MALYPFPQAGDAAGEPSLPIPPALLEELRRALREIRFGAIELVIHDGQVVQLERREKVRLDAALRAQGRVS